MFWSEFLNSSEFFVRLLVSKLWSILYFTVVNSSKRLQRQNMPLTLTCSDYGPESWSRRSSGAYPRRGVWGLNPSPIFYFYFFLSVKIYIKDTERPSELPKWFQWKRHWVVWEDPCRGPPESWCWKPKVFGAYLGSFTVVKTKQRVNTRKHCYLLV